MPRLPRRIAAGTATGTRGAAALRLVAPAPRAQLGGMAAAAASRSVAGVAAADVHRRQQQRNQQVLATVSRGVDQLGTSLRRCSLLHPEREGGREHRLRRVSNAFRMTTDGGPPRPACPAQLHSDAQDGRLPLRVVTFDLDDTLWPTDVVVSRRLVPSLVAGRSRDLVCCVLSIPNMLRASGPAELLSCYVVDPQLLAQLLCRDAASAGVLACDSCHDPHALGTESQRRQYKPSVGDQHSQPCRGLERMMAAVCTLLEPQHSPNGCLPWISLPSVDGLS